MFALVLHWSLVVDWLDPSLRPEFHAMGKMGKNAKKRPSDGDSNKMPKLAPWRVAILTKESGDFGENGKIGKNDEFGTIGEKSPEGWQYPECAKYSNGMPKVAPWRVHLLTTY